MMRPTLNRLGTIIVLGSNLLFSASAFSQDPVDQALLKHGEYLVNGISACSNCHSSREADGTRIDGMQLAGNFVVKTSGFTAYAPNITPDIDTGIGSWTDEQIIRAIREGIRPDGQVLGPPMPFEMYRNISDSDVRAIVAYLRSVPAVKNVVPRSNYDIDLPPNWGPAITSVPDVPPDDKIAYGAYLTGPLGHCVECHTPIVEGHRDFSLIGSGGFIIQNPTGYTFTVVSANITQHPELGMGKWSDDDIKRAITTGVRPDGRQLMPLMAFPNYATISTDDLDAMVAYLRTLPPAVAPPPVPE